MDIYGNLLWKIADDEHNPRSAVTIFSKFIDAATNALFQKRKNCVKSNFPSNKWLVTNVKQLNQICMIDVIKLFWDISSRVLANILRMKNVSQCLW